MHNATTPFLSALQVDSSMHINNILILITLARERRGVCNQFQSINFVEVLQFDGMLLTEVITNEVTNSVTVYTKTV